MVLYDKSGRIVLGNEAAIHLLGHPRGTLVGTHFSAHLAPGCVPEAHHIRAFAGAGCASDFDAVFVHADGHPVHVATTILPARLGEEVVGVYGIVREIRREREVAVADDVAERFRALYLLAASSGKTPAQQIEDTLTLGTGLLKVESAVVMRLRESVVTAAHSVGAFAESLRTLSLEASVCRRMFSAFDTVGVDDARRPPWDREPARSLFPWSSYIVTPFAIAGAFAGIVVFGAHHERGELFSTADRDAVRLISAIVGSALERQWQQERLDALAFSDTLTGLPNRALLADRLQQLIADSRRNHESFALHLLNLDGFKHVNDTAGHADGDDVLRQAAQRLEAALRVSDSVARLGGDEFIILQKRVRNPGEAIALARTLLDLMRLPFVTDTGAHALSASIGMGIFPGDGDNANTLMGHADTALYRAKASGRNRLALYNAARDAAAPRSGTQQTTRD
jgi:diguanylate cyclase (GGDEF)-like protein